MAVAKLEKLLEFDLGRKTKPWETRRSEGKPCGTPFPASLMRSGSHQGTDLIRSKPSWPATREDRSISYLYAWGGWPPRRLRSFVVPPV